MEISIIIPTKDRGRIFERTLLAAVNAVHDIHAEIIVVNDSKVASPPVPDAFQIVRVVNNPHRELHRQGILVRRWQPVS